jgi:uncharacterized RDD family membrane protein YckC
MGMASRADHRSGLADAAGRAAMLPARAAAHVWRDRFEEIVDGVLASPEVTRAVDRALAGPVPEDVARSIVRHRVLERMVAQLADSGELERLLDEALSSGRADTLVDRVVQSDAMHRALEEVLAAPAVRRALARQTAGFSAEVAASIRVRAGALDERLDRRRAPMPGYAGIATRALAFVTDVAACGALYLSVVGVGALVGLLVGGLRPAWLVGLLMGAGWAIVTGGYLVLFWSTAGRTPGMHLLRLRLCDAGLARPPSAARSAVRVAGLVLAIVPCFAGFLPVLFDRRRRGLPDLLAGTVVVYDAGEAGAPTPAAGAAVAAR